MSEIERESDSFKIQYRSADISLVNANLYCFQLASSMFYYKIQASLCTVGSLRLLYGKHSLSF